MPIKHILQLTQGSVVELEALAGEPMDVLVNGFLIAQGEVVVVNDKFGIRLTDIETPSERLRRLQWVGLACAFAAVAFALREGFAAGARPGQWVGDVLALAAGMFWGLTTVVIRTTSLARLSAEKLLFYQVAVSAVALPFLSAGLGERWPDSFSRFALGSLAVQTVIGAFVSYLAWMWMLGRYPATKISVFVFLTPVFSLVAGALWLREPVTPSLLAALALVAVGIVLVNRKPG